MRMRNIWLVVLKRPRVFAPFVSTKEKDAKTLQSTSKLQSRLLPNCCTKKQILFDFILFLSPGMHLWGSMWSLKIVSKISLPKSSNWTFRNAWKPPSSQPSKDASKTCPICGRPTTGSSSTSSTTYYSANSPTSKWFKSLIPRTSEGMFQFLRIFNFLCIQFQFFSLQNVDSWPFC